MADNTNEDLSMEDILSSIKNILAEDEAGTKPATVEKNAEPENQAVPETNPITDVAEVEIEDDILDLSPSMKIDNPNDGINLDAELDNISGEAEDITLADSADTDDLNPANDRPINLDAELDDSAPLFSAENRQGSEYSENEESDPVYMEENSHNFLGDILQDGYRREELDFTQNIEEAVVEPQIHDVEMEEIFDQQEISNPADNINFENEESLTEKVSRDSLSENTEKDNGRYESPNYTTETNSQIAESDLSMTGTVSQSIPVQTSDDDHGNVSKPIPVQTPQEEADAVDVSASIISNFAKMFSKDNTEIREIPQEKVKKPAEIIRELGDSSKTIENIVAEVIRDIIGEEVAQNWHQGINYEKLATEEISRQTKLWLDKNLPVIVEKTVKQEIERVMAKVGVSQ